jgi:hypothetical protein
MNYKRIGAGALFTGLSLLSPAAHADVRYTTTMTMNGNGENAGHGGMAMEMTYFVKGPRERQEMAMNFGQFAMKKISITQCDSDQELQVDPASKVYTSHALSAGIGGFIPSSPMSATTGRGGHRAADETPGTGTVDSTFAAQDLGKETVNGFNTHHYILTIHTKSTGCAGNSDSTMKMEMWVAPGSLGRLDCPKRFQSSDAVGAAPDEDSPCKITTHLNGDMSSMRDMFAHLIVKQIIYKDDKPMMTIQVKNYSTDTLDPSLFSVPADFKKVSQQEYSQAESHAMMQQFRSGGMPGGGNAAAPNGGNAAPSHDGGAGVTMDGDGNGASVTATTPDGGAASVTVTPPDGNNAGGVTVTPPATPDPAEEIKKKIKIPKFHF